MSSESHVDFHVALKGMSIMGVSSSSGCMRVSCSGWKPLYIWLHSCFAVRWSVVSCLAWYSVTCRSVLWALISVTYSGAGFVVSSVGRVSGIGMIGRLFGLMCVVGAIIRLE